MGTTFKVYLPRFLGEAEAPAKEPSVHSVEGMKPGIKTLFMSGYTANVIAQRGVLEEGVDFIQKPFSVTSLARKVRQVLES